MVQKISKLRIKILIDENDYIILNLVELNYHDRVLIQGLLWLDEISVHNDVDEECCPDFSCCEPDLFEKDIKKRRRTHNNFLERLREQGR